MAHTQSEIRTNRLLLRPIRPSDLEDIYRGLSDPQVIEHYGVSFDTLQATKQQMAWYEQPEQCWWAICERDSETFYGAVGFNDISSEHQKAEIGLWLLPAYWGKGIMTEVFPAVCPYAFSELGLHRIEGYVNHGNINCKRAMGKLDFQLEGTMRDCERKDGKYISVDIYALLKS